MKNISIYRFIFFLFIFLGYVSAFAQTNTNEYKAGEEDLELNFEERVDPLPVNNSTYVDNMLSFAKTFLGTPYLSSGSSPTGFDCSGFVSYVLGNFGFDIVHSSYGMAEYGRTVKLSEARAGDLMFFKGSNSGSNKIGHVAIIYEVNPTDGIKFIHASTSKGIAIDQFNGSKYYVPRYVTTKRLDYGVE
ncbi:MAG: C40 family peptidase [Crocinitomicaceae bacterium]|jgi:cell wall-associated NlpC family hydrolase|nr:C40 family peptidase [Crocinitomicaceae bacterium]